MEKKKYDAILNARTYEELKKRARVQAIKDGKSLQDFVNEALEEKLQREEEK